jgi:hypothetical protein
VTFRRGETFTASPDGSDNFHLFVVVSKPDEDPQHVVVVNLTTVRGVWSDDMTCVLERGDHKFVKHKSRVAYEYAKVVTLAALSDALENRLIFRNADMPAAMLARITTGFGASKRVSRSLRTLLSEQGLL